MSSVPDAPSAEQAYRIGVMMMDVEGKDTDGFRALVEEAVASLSRELEREHRLAVDVMTFEGPHLLPGAGAYAPLDFFEIGFAEKAERNIPFLLIVTEVDLSASGINYTLALPSQLTNIAIVSTKRLDPQFWGEEHDAERAATRLARLLLHSFCQLLNLPARPESDNIMHRVETVEDLDAMRQLDETQWQRLSKVLPREAHERRTRDGRFGFVLSTLVRDFPEILRAVRRANPLRLVLKLPTMIAAALSVIIVLLFGAETWDVAAAVSLPQITLFSIVSIAAALYLLYRSFALEAVLGRDRVLTETSVVTVTATLLALLATLLILFVGFGLLMYVGIVTIFPRPLMESWVSTGDATTTIDHLKLSLFLATMGVLAGSLGGRSDSRDVVRSVLFVDER